MKLFILGLFFTFNAFAADFSQIDASQFPDGPHETVTPGSLCDRPDTYRYPENIPYCQRDVESTLKNNIIQDYDKRFGFQIRKMNRQDFKIDHYIPLCMGGSNRRDNLWPQYKTIFVLTDPIEEKLCKLMAMGRMKQREAVGMIRHVKNNLETAPRVNSELDSKLR